MKGYVVKGSRRWLFVSLMTMRYGMYNPMIRELWRVYEEGYTMSELREFVAHWNWLDEEELLENSFSSF